MYRARPWTIRQVAGFGTAEDTNGRYKYLLAHGETGLSTDFDLPTLLGYDSDHPVGRPEVGKIGVAVDTLEDVRLLMQDIPLDQVSTSYTINASAFVLMGMYETVAKAQGVRAEQITGTMPERHPEGVHGAERVHLSAAAGRQAGGRHDGVRGDDDAAIQPGQRLRLSHPGCGQPRRSRSWRSRWRPGIATSPGRSSGD